MGVLYTPSCVSGSESSEKLPKTGSKEALGSGSKLNWCGSSEDANEDAVEDGGSEAELTGWGTIAFVKGDHPSTLAAGFVNPISEAGRTVFSELAVVVVRD